MLIAKSYRFRIYPTPEQDRLFRRTAGCCRVVYNACLFQRRVWGERHRISAYGQINELGALKQAFPWLKEAPSHCLQQAVLDLDCGFQNFFEGRNGFPKSRKRSDGLSFRFPDPKQFEFTKDAVRLPKAGWVVWRQHRIPSGRPKTVTVSFDGGQWYASVACVDVKIADVETRNGPTVGIDMGVAKPLQLSTGQTIDLPKQSKSEKHRRKVLAQRFARKQKGSANRRKAVRKLAGYEARIKRRRYDMAQRATSWIIKHYGAIAIEDLKLKNMTASAKGTVEQPGRNVRQKAGLNRVLLDVAPGQIGRMLDYKAEWTGSAVIRVNPAGTSQTCACCGHRHKDNRKNQATFHCQNCGHNANADDNASIVIEQRAFGTKPTGGRPGIACPVNPGRGQQQELFGAIH